MSPRNSAPTIAAILTAAEKLLETGGPEAVTLRAVGDFAGISRMAPYRHFDDKAALLHALAQRYLTQMAELIRAGAAQEENPAAKLRAGSRAYIDHALKKPHHYQLIFGDVPLSEPGPELERAADDAMRAIEELVNEQVQESGKSQRTPTRELATVLWTLLHGLAALQITGHLHEPRTIDGDQHLDTLLELALSRLSLSRPYSIER